MSSIISNIAKNSLLFSGVTGGLLGGGCGVNMAYKNCNMDLSMKPHHMLGELYCASMIVVGSTGLGAIIGTSIAVSSPIIIPYTIFKKINDHRKKF